MVSRLATRRLVSASFALGALVALAWPAAASGPEAEAEWFLGEAAGRIDLAAEVALAGKAGCEALAGDSVGQGIDPLELSAAAQPGERPGMLLAWSAHGRNAVPNGDAWASTRQFPGRPH